MAAEASPPSGGPPGGSPAPASRNIFDEQRRNRRDTWLLIAAFVALLAFIGYGFDLFIFNAARVAHPGGVPVPVPIAATFATLFGMGSAWFGYRFGDRAVLASSFARAVDADDASPDVKRLLKRWRSPPASRSPGCTSSTSRIRMRSPPAATRSTRPSR
jgi:hypothetical protein